jgi:hypothetical protein
MNWDHFIGIGYNRGRPYYIRWQTSNWQDWCPPTMKEQRDELGEWRENQNIKPAPKSDDKDKKKSYTKKQLASLVTKRVKLAMDKSSEELKTPDDAKAYIMSLIQGCCSQNKVPGSVPGTGDTYVPSSYSKLYSEEG